MLLKTDFLVNTVQILELAVILRWNIEEVKLNKNKQKGFFVQLLQTR